MNQRFALDRRASGLLLHPTCLPGPHGSGDLGPEAFRFVDFLAAAGQRWWQMLPVGPIGPGNSPYSSPSAFAGNPLLISLPILVEDGLLSAEDVERADGVEDGRVRYGPMRRFRESRLRRAYEVFGRSRRHRLQGALEQFCRQQREWLEDYALFIALRRAQRGRPWPTWESGLRVRRVGALRRARQALRGQVEFAQFVQFLFDRQWSGLKRHCHQRGVGLIGDIPIFVDHASSDVWAHQELFQLDRRGRPRVVSGCPPDMFARDGQRWGHPLYRWERHHATGFAWWIARFEALLGRFDAARIDHFLGFYRFWAVPARARTARRGRWLPTPGRELLSAVLGALGRIEIVAENLGLVTPQAEALREDFAFPGMRVMRWAFGAGEGARYHQPHNYPRRCVAYTGTHDTETVIGWFGAPRAGRVRSGDQNKRSTAGLADRARAERYLASDGRELHWAMIRAAMMSAADTVIFPVQDLLGLGREARMNNPSTARGNWDWRVRPGTLTDALVGRLRELSILYQRAPAD